MTEWERESKNTYTHCLIKTETSFDITQNTKSKLIRRLLELQFYHTLCLVHIS